MLRRFNAMSLLAMLLLTVLAYLAYRPGLSGGFLFDDFGNLPILGATGPIDNGATFWRYVTSGIADPTGRPLTLLTFLLDAHDWPADPYPFKRTNLILHLVNGGLLCVLLFRLGRVLAIDISWARTAALTGTALWLLHPLLVSTTLYIVQREAMLPATCVMAGLLMWLHGRNQLVAGKVLPGMLWSAIGLGGFTLLSVLAKANGALLPVFALLLEIVVMRIYQPMHAGAGRRAHRGILLVLGAIPAAVILIYLTCVAIAGILSGDNVAGRPWSIAQRLLTEPRVLVDYLSLLWMPRPFSSGLFNDHYLASTSWLHPANTLPSVLLVLGLIAGAWWVRRRHPALAIAILFYFAGQLLESTSIPLELYFEHRNYLPALLLFWPLGLWLADMRTLPVIKRGLMIALPLGLALMTHARAEVWGNEQTQALIWAHINPESGRAQANVAQVEMEHGQVVDATRRLQKLIATQPDQVQIVFNLIGAHCMAGGIAAGDMAAAQNAMLNTPNTGSLFAHWFERMLPVALAGSCPGLGTKELLSLINAGLLNPKLAAVGPRQDLIYMRARIILAQRHPDAALADFVQALDLQVRPGMALETAATLGAAGYPSQGLRLLDHYQQVQKKAMSPGIGMPMLHEWVLARQNYWPHEVAHLRHQLSLDVQTRSANNAAPKPDQKNSH